MLKEMNDRLRPLGIQAYTAKVGWMTFDSKTKSKMFFDTIKDIEVFYFSPKIEIEEGNTSLSLDLDIDVALLRQRLGDTTSTLEDLIAKELQGLSLIGILVRDVKRPSK